MTRIRPRSNQPACCSGSSARRGSRIQSTSIGAPTSSTLRPARSRTVEWRPSAPTTSPARTSSGPSGVSARTPTTDPPSSTSSATRARMVSMETVSPARTSSVTTGPTRRSSSASSMRCAPGRVDSPPTSTMSAPCAARSRPCAMAASAPYHWPPSENESGVTFTTPITRQRSLAGSSVTRAVYAGSSPSRACARSGAAPAAARPGTPPPRARPARSWARPWCWGRRRSAAARPGRTWR